MPQPSPRFGHCHRCGRLITVDALNPAGACTSDCGGQVLTVLEREEGQER